MKLKIGIFIPAALVVFLIGAMEQVKKPTYLGLEARTIEAVTYTKDETLIETHQVTCRYYVTLGDGTPLKFTRTYPGTVEHCQYEKDATVQIEVHETRFGEKTYQLLGIN